MSIYFDFNKNIGGLKTACHKCKRKVEINHQLTVCVFQRNKQGDIKELYFHANCYKPGSILGMEEI